MKDPPGHIYLERPIMRRTSYNLLPPSFTISTASNPMTQTLRWRFSFLQDQAVGMATSHCASGIWQPCDKLRAKSGPAGVSPQDAVCRIGKALSVTYYDRKHKAYGWSSKAKEDTQNTKYMLYALNATRALFSTHTRRNFAFTPSYKNVRHWGVFIRHWNGGPIQIKIWKLLVRTSVLQYCTDQNWAGQIVFSREAEEWSADPRWNKNKTK